MFLNWSWRSTSSDFDVHQGTIFSPSSSRSEVSRSDMLQMFAHVAWMCCYPMLVKSPSVLIYECAWLNHCLKHGSHMISHCLYPQFEIKCHVYIPSLYIIYIYTYFWWLYIIIIYIHIINLYKIMISHWSTVYLLVIIWYYDILWSYYLKWTYCYPFSFVGWWNHQAILHAGWTMRSAGWWLVREFTWDSTIKHMDTYPLVN